MAKKITVKYYLNKKTKDISEYSIQDQDGNITQEGLVYPVYVQVIYNQNNTKFKSLMNEIFVMQGLPNLEELDATYLKLRRFDEGNIRKIMQYEIEQYGEDYDLKGFNDKYRLYSTSIHNLIGRYILKEIRSYVRLRCPVANRALKFNIYETEAFVIITILKMMYPDFDNFMNDELKKLITISREYFELTRFMTVESVIYPSQLEKGDMFENYGYYEYFKDFNHPLLIDWLNETYPRELSQMMKEKGESQDKIDEMISVINKILNSFTG